MKKNTKNNDLSSITAIIIFIIIVALYAFYWSLDTPIEKLFMMIFIFLFGIPILSIVTSYNLNKIKSTSNRKKNELNYIKSNGNTSDKPSKSKKTYKHKECDSEEYKLLRDYIIACSKNKLMNRECILSFKNELDYRLGSHRYSYKDFDFDNDLHEIYIKIKNNCLDNEDYIYLKTWLSEHLDFNY